MRVKDEIKKDINNNRTIEAQLRLNNELLLDLRTLIAALTPDGLKAAATIKHDEQINVKERTEDDVHVMEMPFSSRVRSILRGNNIQYFSDFEGVTAEEIRKFGAIGVTAMDEIRRVLAQYGMTLPDYKK
jgi:DNA-directed RNA polymerase alpha subunit